jgi:hypothetical protein
MTRAPTASAPVSCNTLGIRRSLFVLPSDDGKNRLYITVGCTLWKHVFCVTVPDGTETGKRSCAVAKQAKLIYGDTCMKRRADCDLKNEHGQCQPFDYKRCIGRRFDHSQVKHLAGPNGKVNAATDADPYCVRTCEDNAPITAGLTKGRRAGDGGGRLPYNPGAPAIEVVEATKTTPDGHESQSIAALAEGYIGGVAGQQMAERIITFAKTEGLCVQSAQNS